MTYRGRVKNGVIVLDSGTSLSEGTDVLVAPVSGASEDDATRRLREGLMSLAGTLKDAPPDLARNHDHYIHGTPKK